MHVSPGFFALVDAARRHYRGTVLARQSRAADARAAGQPKSLAKSFAYLAETLVDAAEWRLASLCALR
jgi:hypothetical protein